jgi:hypothetical protein
MKIDVFLKLYESKKTTESKEKLVADHVKNIQVKYSDKVDRAGIIAKHSYYEKQVGADGVEREVFRQNSAAKYMLYYLTLVDLYTDLEIDFKESLDTFEKINGSILDTIISYIDDRELKEFQMLLDFACDDIITNEYELHSFVRSQVEWFGNLVSGIISPVLQQFDFEKI